jgi:hypothetical protein
VYGMGSGSKSIFLFLLLFFFFLFLETESHYVAQAGFELKILLLQPPKCWDYRCVPPSSKSILLQMDMHS